jgi:hypothetical protein
LDVSHIRRLDAIASSPDCSNFWNSSPEGGVISLQGVGTEQAVTSEMPAELLLYKQATRRQNLSAPNGHMALAHSFMLECWSAVGPHQTWVVY